MLKLRPTAGTALLDLARFAGRVRLRLTASSDTTPDLATATDAACRECGGQEHRMPDQRVPDPAQFVPDPQRAGNTPVVELATVQAPMVWCARCQTWLHAIGCYSTHRA